MAIIPRLVFVFLVASSASGLPFLSKDNVPGSASSMPDSAPPPVMPVSPGSSQGGNMRPIPSEESLLNPVSGQKSAPTGATSSPGNAPSLNSTTKPMQAPVTNSTPGAGVNQTENSTKRVGDAATATPAGSQADAPGIPGLPSGSRIYSNIGQPGNKGQPNPGMEPAGANNTGMGGSSVLKKRQFDPTDPCDPCYDPCATKGTENSLLPLCTKDPCATPDPCATETTPDPCATQDPCLPLCTMDPCATDAAGKPVHPAAQAGA